MVASRERHGECGLSGGTGRACEEQSASQRRWLNTHSTTPRWAPAFSRVSMSELARDHPGASESFDRSNARGTTAYETRLLVSTRLSCEHRRGARTRNRRARDEIDQAEWRSRRDRRAWWRPAWRHIHVTALAEGRFGHSFSSISCRGIQTRSHPTETALNSGPHEPPHAIGRGRVSAAGSESRSRSVFGEIQRGPRQHHRQSWPRSSALNSAAARRQVAPVDFSTSMSDRGRDGFYSRSRPQH